MTDQWETKAVPSLARQTVHEPGWEPFAVGEGWLWLRRRCEAVVAAPGPKRARLVAAMESTANRHEMVQYLPFRVTAARFRRVVGRAPAVDELTRCNCMHAGLVGHTMCGWDDDRDLPRFIAAAMP